MVCLSDPADGRVFHAGLAELHVPSFSHQWEDVGPKHSRWLHRVKLEATLLRRYVDFLRSEDARPWFYLVPDRKTAGRTWRGHVSIPSRTDITFSLVIYLSKEYPVVPPTCFIEDSIVTLAGSKIYPTRRFPPERDPGTGEWMKDPASGHSFVMICHDHMADVQGAWRSNLGIVHFFIRQIWFWFAAMQNVILREWDSISPRG